MGIKHIVFDWDGTLADTYPVISAAYNYTFDKLGLPRISYDEIKRITATLQNKDNLTYIFGERKEEAAKFYYEYINVHHAANLEPMPYAKDMVEHCRKLGQKCYLLTNKKTKYVAEEINKIGFNGLFDKVIAAGEFAEDKPHPIATHALFDNKLPETDTILVIGDGEADVKVARTYDHDGKKTKCLIYDPKQKYNGTEPDYKIIDWRDAVAIINKEAGD